MAYYAGEAIAYIGALGLVLWAGAKAIQGATAAIRWFKSR